jgi:hypothetical protein
MTFGLETGGLGCAAAISDAVAVGTYIGGLGSGDSNHDAGLAGTGGFGSGVLSIVISCDLQR